MLGHLAPGDSTQAAAPNLLDVVAVHEHDVVPVGPVDVQVDLTDVWRCSFGSGLQFLPQEHTDHLGIIAIGQLVEPRVQTRHGEPALSCHAAHKWNKLPTEVTSAPNPG